MTCTPSPPSAASSRLEVVGGADHRRWSPRAAPACTIAVWPSREIDTPGCGGTTRLHARSAFSARCVDGRPPRWNAGSPTVFVGRVHDDHQAVAGEAAEVAVDRACGPATDSEPVASQPAPDSACSTLRREDAERRRATSDPGDRDRRGSGSRSSGRGGRSVRRWSSGDLMHVRPTRGRPRGAHRDAPPCSIASSSESCRRRPPQTCSHSSNTPSSAMANTDEVPRLVAADHAGLQQHAEVLGHVLLRRIKRLLQLADGRLAVAQAVEQPDAHRLSEHAEALRDQIHELLGQRVRNGESSGIHNSTVDKE